METSTLPKGLGNLEEQTLLEPLRQRWDNVTNSDKIMEQAEGLIPEKVQVRGKKGVYYAIRWKQPKEEYTSSGIKIPSKWIDVRVVEDADSPLQAVGKDEKGRTVYLYSKKNSEANAVAKFQRLKEFVNDFPEIISQVKKDVGQKQEADILYVITKTGYRIGSYKDTKATQKAFGISTLLGKHVKVNGNDVTFDFVGKHGIEARKTIYNDPILSKIISSRYSSSLAPLFSKSDRDVRRYFDTISSKLYKIHDFRTKLANEIALESLMHYYPKNEKEFEKSKWKVAETVSKEIGNTPEESMKSYIAPEVWSVWFAELKESKILKGISLLRDLVNQIYYDGEAEWDKLPDNVFFPDDELESESEKNMLEKAAEKDLEEEKEGNRDLFNVKEGDEGKLTIDEHSTFLSEDAAKSLEGIKTYKEWERKRKEMSEKASVHHDFRIKLDDRDFLIGFTGTLGNLKDTSKLLEPHRKKMLIPSFKAHTGHGKLKWQTEVGQDKSWILEPGSPGAARGSTNWAAIIKLEKDAKIKFGKVDEHFIEMEFTNTENIPEGRWILQSVPLGKERKWMLSYPDKQEFEVDIEKAGWKHEHDGYPEHPIAVKHHQKYFSGKEVPPKEYPEEILRLLSDKLATKETIQAIKQNPVLIRQLLNKFSASALRYIAMYSSDPKILSKLLESKSDLVRWRLAMNSNSPIEVKRQLAIDKSTDVRLALTGSLNTSIEAEKELLRTMSFDSEDVVARSAKRRWLSESRKEIIEYFRKHYTFPSSLLPEWLSEIKGMSDMGKEDPSKTVVKLIKAMYDKTPFGNIHTSMVSAWEKSSSSPLSLVLKMAIGDLYDGKIIFHKTKVESGGASEKTLKRSYKQLVSKYGEEKVKQYVKIHYKLTQDILDIVFPGKKTFTLYRGTESSEVKQLKSGAKFEVNQNPVSSWTLLASVAHDFSGDQEHGVVLEAKIPKSEIWSFFYAYAYHGNEREFLVIGKPNRSVILRKKAADLEADVKKIGWKHEHDGYPEHPIAVKHHQEYFSGKKVVPEEYLKEISFLFTGEYVGEKEMDNAIQQNSELIRLLLDKFPNKAKYYIAMFSIDSEVLNKLVKHKDEEIRRLIAENREVPIKIKRQLAIDESIEVKLELIESLSIFDETEREILRTMISDSDSTVVEQAREKLLEGEKRKVIRYFGEYYTLPSSLPPEWLSEIKDMADMKKDNPSEEIIKLVDAMYDETPFRDIHKNIKEDWEHSSNHPSSLVLKKIIGDLYDGKVIFHETKIRPGSDEEEALEKSYKRLVSKYGEEKVKQYVEIHYKLTQDMLNIVFPGKETFLLFRGTTSEEIKKSKLGAQFEVNQNPVSSWTLRESVAYDFSNLRKFGVVLEAEIPKEEIWSFFYSHAYKGNEREFLVIGKPDRGVVIRRRKYV